MLKRQSLRRGSFLLLFVSFSILLAWAVRSYYQTLPGEPIRIGLIGPFGEPDGAGEQMVNAAELAIRPVNEAGGLLVGRRRHLVELVVADDADNPEQATIVAQRLINQENVVAIVGPPYSRQAIAAARVAENVCVPLVSPTSTNPETTLGRQCVFRATFVDDFQGYAMARFTLNELQRQRAAVLYDISNTYNRGLAEAFRDAFENLGGQIVAFESYIVGEPDFRPLLTNIKNSGAEVLFLPNYTDEVILQGQLARELGLDAVFLGSDSWQADLIAPYNEFNGSYYSGHFCRDMENPLIADFSNRYQAAYNREINGLIALTYDTVKMIFAAAQDQGEVEARAIQTGLYNITYTGLTGSIHFAATGDPEKAVAVWRLENGTRNCHALFEP